MMQFPASSGPGDRTSYMFTYFDAHPKRPKLVDVMEVRTAGTTSLPARQREEGAEQTHIY